MIKGMFWDWNREGMKDGSILLLLHAQRLLITEKPPHFYTLSFLLKKKMILECRLFGHFTFYLSQDVEMVINIECLECIFFEINCFECLC